MLQHKRRHRRCNINVVFSLRIACFNSVFSLVTFLFGYPEKNLYQFSIKKLRVRVIYECALYLNKYGNSQPSTNAHQLTESHKNPDREVMDNSRQVSLTISALDGSASIELPEVYAIDKIAMRTVSVPHDQLQRYAHLRNLNLPSVDEEVLLLVRVNAPEAFCIEDIRKGKVKQSIAVKLPLGWSLFGPTVYYVSTMLFFNLRLMLQTRVIYTVNDHGQLPPRPATRLLLWCPPKVHRKMITNNVKRKQHGMLLIVLSDRCETFYAVRYW